MAYNSRFHLIHLFILTVLVAGFSACSDNERKLPIYGERDTVIKTVDGKEVTDTIYNTIPPFSFINQEGDTVSEKLVEGKIYITDFFFTTCPTICPVMKRQMIKVFNDIKGKPDVMILSHSIDPEHDTPQVLKKYAQDLGVEGPQWQFLTGEKEKIYEIGQKSYLSTAKEDKSAEGGYIHSGAFILVDKEKHVRGMYDGTTEEGTQKLIADIKTLQEEYNTK
ncbi:SCO family protein [Dyadobacter sediminis]|uniref:SCO family protein n=1 Tax=Dyadobacter sediminis TaxID=1493691 RepID=A0A5R9KB43_9BACT|nr:SCO family protein [Dyadobacter sediminis]TLU91959.1 SCO family protein [Dyadobacter sediminis]GGB98727.1 SCO family protein [Dyadobacter sediminis]